MINPDDAQNAIQLYNLPLIKQLTKKEYDELRLLFFDMFEEEAELAEVA